MNDNRITLQYSVEESQLKFEVHRLVCNALDRLTSIACEHPSVNTVMAMTTVDEISSLRTELAKIDLLLGDASTIIDNYVDYKHKKRMQNVAASTPEMPEMPEMPDIEALTEKIQHFKDKIKTHENAD